MKGLNFNIDANLDLGASHVLITNGIFAQPGGIIFLQHQASNNAYGTIFRGGDDSTGSSSQLFLTGKNNAGGGNMEFVVPNTAGTFDVTAMRIVKGDNAYLSMETHRITNLAQATTDMDAAPITKMWGTWSPTLTWATATPSGVTSAARYVQIGKTVYYIVNIYSADSNGCTGLTITTPSTAANTGVYYQASSMERYGVAGNTWKDPGAVVAAAGNTIAFWDFGAATDGQLIYVFVSGWYEVA